MIGWDRDRLRVRWVDGGLYIEAEGVGLLLDAPEGCSTLLHEELGRIGTILLSGGRIRSVGGLLPLLCAMDAVRTDPLVVWSPAGEERPGLLCDAWSRGFVGGYPLLVDVEAPGRRFEAGPFAIESVPVVRGEPRWRGGEGVSLVVAAGFRVSYGGVTFGFAPGAGPGAHRIARGADLAVLEVGVLPWPASNDDLRHDVVAATAAGAGARRLVLVGDDGEPLGERPA